MRGTQFSGFFITHEWDGQNRLIDPHFRNIKIYDLAHDTDGDGVFSDIEERQGRDPWVAEP